MTVEVKICLLRPEAKMPAYAKPGDSGMDLVLPEDVVISPGYPAFVDLGIAVAIPEGYEGQIRSRSGLTKKGLTACSGLGTIDSQFRGSLGITLMWHAQPDSSLSDTWSFKAGDRIAQLVIAPVVRAEVVTVASLADLGETERGTGGFGHTGV
jgi:dUTP pyrophosphatase